MAREPESEGLPRGLSHHFTKFPTAKIKCSPQSIKPAEKSSWLKENEINYSTSQFINKQAQDIKWNKCNPETRWQIFAGKKQIVPRKIILHFRIAFAARGASDFM